MARIPAKCPECGRTKAWQEEVNAFRSGILAGLFKKSAGCYRVTYRCKKVRSQSGVRTGCINWFPGIFRGIPAF